MRIPHVQPQNTISSTFDFENTEKYEGEISDVVEKLWKDGYPNKDTVLVDDLYHAQFNLVDDEGDNLYQRKGAYLHC